MGVSAVPEYTLAPIALADELVASFRDARRPTPPMAAGHRLTGPPDFIGVAAQRSGTTWWFRTLVTHPPIRPPRGRRKELHFFDRFSARELQDADIADYHELFPRPRGCVAGEWTPGYMRDPWTPRLLQRAAPDAKLLVLLRDPIERFRSGVPHRLARIPGGRREVITTDAVERSRYGSQLRRLLAFHDRENVLVLQYEKCRLDPVGEYRRTLRFIGVSADHEPHTIERPRGTSTASSKGPLWPDLEAALLATLEPEVELLQTMVPELELHLWPNFAHLANAASA
jgi:hypothetical protein